MTTQTYEEIPCESQADWLARRKEGIGASEASAVLGVSPWLTVAELWGLKTGVMDPAEDNARFAWGRRLEDDIIDAYSEETGRLVLPNKGGFTLLRSTVHPFMQATLDAEIAPIDDRGPGLFEAKSATIYRKDEWADEPPLEYQCQIQHGLAVTGYRWGSIAVFFGDFKFIWVDFERNDTIIDYIVRKESDFWERVVTETPPEVDGSEGATELLKRLFPKPEPGQVVALPADFIEIDREYQETKAAIKKLEARESELKNRICAAIGSAEVGMLSSGDSYKWGHISKVIPAHGEYTQNYRQLTRRAKKGAK